MRKCVLARLMNRFGSHLAGIVKFAYPETGQWQEFGAYLLLGLYVVKTRVT